MIERCNTQIVPVEGSRLRHIEDEKARPNCGAEDRDDGPRIIDERPRHQGEKIEPERPGAEQDLQRMEPVGRREGNEDADGKRQRGSMG